jgi:hypothetical protein
MTVPNPHTVDAPASAAAMLLKAIYRGDQVTCVALANRAQTMLAEHPDQAISWQWIIDRWEESNLSQPPQDRPRYGPIGAGLPVHRLPPEPATSASRSPRSRRRGAGGPLAGRQ